MYPINTGRLELAKMWTTPEFTNKGKTNKNAKKIAEKTSGNQRKLQFYRSYSDGDFQKAMVDNRSIESIKSSHLSEHQSAKQNSGIGWSVQITWVLGRILGLPVSTLLTWQNQYS